MTILSPTLGGALDMEQKEIRAMRSKLKTWVDDPSLRAGSPLGYCLFVSCRDTLASAMESLGMLHLASAAIDEYEVSKGRR